jgi:hypothetical protein
MSTKEQLSVFKDILAILEECIKIVKRHPKFFTIIFFLAVLYIFTRYVVFDRPSACVNNFYASLNESNYENAWNQLSENYKRDIFGYDFEKFESGYETTNNFGNISIEYGDSKVNPIPLLFIKQRDYQVRYEVEDRIDRSKLSKTGQQAWNSFWTEVSEGKSLDRLIRSPQRNFTLDRSFVQDVRIIKEHDQWKIARINITEVGLKRK